MNCRTAQSSAPTAALFTAVVLLISASITAQTSTGPSSSSQQTTVAVPLEPGKPIERELAGGPSHSYQLTLAAGQYLHVVVDQRGIDVVVVLLGPNGEKFIEVDSPNGTWGPEFVHFVAESPGSYRLEVRALDKMAPTGRYEAKIEHLREATPKDGSLVMAQRAFMEAELLREQGGAESLKKAAESYEKSVPLYRSVSDRSGEALTLLGLSLVYDVLGEKQRALALYNQASSIYRSVGDVAGEANALIGIGNIYYALGDNPKSLDSYRQALPLRKATGDHRGEAEALTDIGNAYFKMGENQRAVEFYSQVLPLLRIMEDRADEAITLDNIGRAYSNAGERQKALNFYNQALPLRRVVEDRSGEALTLNSIGEVYSGLGENQKALDYYMKALPLRHELRDLQGEAVTLHEIGVVYYRLGERQRALDYYTQALPLRRAVGDRQGEAATLHEIGFVYYSLGEKQKALDYYTQALPLRRAAGDRQGEAATLHEIGFVYSGLGENQKALDYYTQALPLRRAVGDRGGEAVTLNNIGWAYYLLGENQKALDYYGKALPIYRSVGDRAGEALALKNTASAYYSLGEKAKALEYSTSSLPLYRAVGDRQGEGNMLQDIGVLFGQKQVALDHFTEALESFRKTGDHAGEANMLLARGVFYLAIGETQNALDTLGEVLPLFRKLGDRSGEATSLSNMGTVYSTLFETQKALDYYGQALPLYRSIGDRPNEANTLKSIGLLYGGLAENQKALQYLEQALSIYRAMGDRQGEFNALTSIPLTCVLLGEQQKALDYSEQALRLMGSIRDRTVEGTMLVEMGFVYLAIGDKQKALEYFGQAHVEIFPAGNSVRLAMMAHIESEFGNPEKAVAHIEASLAIIESLRSRVVRKDLRTSYFTSVQDQYEFYISLLMQLHKQQPLKGFEATALRASERARARGLVELLTEAHANIREGVDPALLERERALQHLLNANGELRLLALVGTNAADRGGPPAQEIGALSTEYEEVEAKIRQTSPRYAALTQPMALDLRKTQGDVLDPDMLLLEYALGDEQSYLWAVTQNSISSYELPKRAEIETSARGVYELLTARNQHQKDETAEQRRTRMAQADAQLPEAAAQLSQMILGPVGKQLEKKRLLVVADGALQYVPFGMLPTPLEKDGQPLVVDHEIVTLPSASVLAELRKEPAGRTPADKTLAVFADPVFAADDERIRPVSGKSGKPTPTVKASTDSRILEREKKVGKSNAFLIGLRIPRLTYTRQEAEQIMALVPASQSMTALDFKASRATATNPQLAQYRYVHFATHGYLDSEHPEFSALVLSMVDEQGTQQDGFIWAHEVYNLRLPVELVVLSACETGLGKDIKGEGLVGLTRGFMYAGAARVVVSLWSVDDQATAELMERFYRGMLTDKLRPAAALRAAQIEMWKQKQWQAPYYWAAFTIQGEWR